MPALGERTVAGLAAALAARTPTPGGGAAAAATAALGMAAGAMAARYTTGPKWADRAAEAEALAGSLDAAAAQVLALADRDEAAFAAAQAARKAGDAAAAARAEAEAAAVPLAVMAACADRAAALAAFLPRCNPNLVSDVRVALHLLDGAARAAWATALANRPDEEARALGTALLARCAAATQAGA